MLTNDEFFEDTKAKRRKSLEGKRMAKERFEYDEEHLEEDFDREPTKIKIRPHKVIEYLEEDV